MFQKLLVFLGGLLLLTLLLAPRLVPALLRRIGRSMGVARQIGRELTSDEELANSPLLKYEVRAGELLARKYLIEHPVTEDEALQQSVCEAGRRLVEHVGRQAIPYRFFVFEDRALNAFAVPGGAIFISRSLVELCAGDEAQLAGVLAHELVHVDRKHAVRNLARETALRAGIRFLPLGRGVFLQRVIGGMEKLLTTGYRRDQEMEADLLGTRLAGRAGFSPDGLLRLLEALRQRYPDERSLVAEVLGYFSTHPPLRDRIARLRGAMA